MWKQVRTCLVAALLVGAVASPKIANATTVEKALLVESINGTALSRLTLSKRATERLGIETKPVIAAARAGTSVKLSVPYSALIYDKNGATWVYTNPKGTVYVRGSVTVELIERDLALLSKGPKIGTKVATVGVAELFGSELGVGGGH